MIVTFTGTREGMSKRQREVWIVLCRSLNIATLRHGVCLGSDEDAVLIHSAVGPGTAVVWGYPSNLPEFVSEKAIEKSHRLMIPMHPLDRDMEMVKGCDLVVATPLDMQEVRRSGTWFTIRYARKHDIPILILDR